jgi:hypothetical protein
MLVTLCAEEDVATGEGGAPTEASAEEAPPAEQGGGDAPAENTV